MASSLDIIAENVANSFESIIIAAISESKNRPDSNNPFSKLKIDILTDGAIFSAMIIRLLCETCGKELTIDNEGNRDKNSNFCQCIVTEDSYEDSEDEFEEESLKSSEEGSEEETLSEEIMKIE